MDRRGLISDINCVMCGVCECDDLCDESVCVVLIEQEHFVSNFVLQRARDVKLADNIAEWCPFKKREFLCE